MQGGASPRGALVVPEPPTWKLHTARALALLGLLIAFLVVAWFVLAALNKPAGTVGLILTLIVIAWGGIVYFVIEAQRTKDARPYPRISDCRSLPGEFLENYYSDEPPLWWSGAGRAAHRALFEPPPKLLSPDALDLRVLRRPPREHLGEGESVGARVVRERGEPIRYRLPPELESLSWAVSNTLERKHAHFKRGDRIAIVSKITPHEKDGDGVVDRVDVDIICGRLSDEYVTSQNPEMNYENSCWERLGWERLGYVGPHTVRQFFSHGDGPGGSDRRLPDFPAGEECERRPALRMAAHLVLLLPTTKGKREWDQREFLLQVRGHNVATGTGGLTSSMGSGMDFADAQEGGFLRTRSKQHGLFTNYVLRELREEVQVQSWELEKLLLVTITRDLERLGQPTAILLGELKEKVTYATLQERWKRMRTAGGGGRRFLRAPSKTGWEHWESDNLVHRSVGEIDQIIQSDFVEGGTKACLYYLKDLGGGKWEKLPCWEPLVRAQ